MEVIAQGNCNQRKHTQGIQSRYNDNHFVDDFYPNRNTDITLRIRVAISPVERVPIQIDGGLNLISKVPVFECDRIRVVILIVLLIAKCVLKYEIFLKLSRSNTTYKVATRPKRTYIKVVRHNAPPKIFLTTGPFRFRALRGRIRPGTLC